MLNISTLEKLCKVGEVPNAIGGRRALDMYTADDFARHIEQVQTCVQDEMRYAQAVYEEQAKRHRQPATQYKIGDQLYLSSRNIRTFAQARSSIGSNSARTQLSKRLSLKQVFQPRFPLLLNTGFTPPMIRSLQSEVLGGIAPQMYYSKLSWILPYQY